MNLYLGIGIVLLLVFYLVFGVYLVSDMRLPDVRRIARSLWLRLEKDDKKFLLWTWRFVNVYLMILIGLR